MLHEERYHEAADKAKIFFQYWKPESKPKAVILYVHGLGSHSGRFGHWAERFVNTGSVFAAFDQRGHGRSEGKRGRPLHMDQTLNDIAEFAGILRDEFPGIPLILYGHSMGGVMVINYVLSKRPAMDGLIASSPWLALVKPPAPGLIKTMKPLVKLIPGMTLSNGLDPNDISRDPEEVRKYHEDPLVHGKICIGLFFSVHLGGLNALENGTNINIPFLLMHGTGDKITSCPTSIRLAEILGDKVDFKTWEGGYHELHHEDLRNDLFDYIHAWQQKNKLG